MQQMWLIFLPGEVQLLFLQLGISLVKELPYTRGHRERRLPPVHSGSCLALLSGIRFSAPFARPFCQIVLFVLSHARHFQRDSFSA